MKTAITFSLACVLAALFAACVTVTNTPLDTTAAWWLDKLSWPIPTALTATGFTGVILSMVFAHEWDERWFFGSLALIGIALICAFVADLLIVRP
jgi:uncharacterized membrane protein YfcA